MKFSDSSEHVLHAAWSDLDQRQTSGVSVGEFLGAPDDAGLRADG